MSPWHGHRPTGRRGWALAGAATAPDAPWPASWGDGFYWRSHGKWAVAIDELGRFRFDNLEPIDYYGYVDGTVPEGTVVTPTGDGGYRFSYPQGPTSHRLQGGTPEPVQWRVILLPDSPVRPIPQ